MSSSADRLDTCIIAAGIVTALFAFIIVAICAQLDVSRDVLLQLEVYLLPTIAVITYIATYALTSSDMQNR